MIMVEPTSDVVARLFISPSPVLVLNFTVRDSVTVTTDTFARAGLATERAVMVVVPPDKAFTVPSSVTFATLGSLEAQMTLPLDPTGSTMALSLPEAPTLSLSIAGSTVSSVGTPMASTPRVLSRPNGVAALPSASDFGASRPESLPSANSSSAGFADGPPASSTAPSSSGASATTGFITRLLLTSEAASR